MDRLLFMDRYTQLDADLLDVFPVSSRKSMAKIEDILIDSGRGAEVADAGGLSGQIAQAVKDIEEAKAESCTRMLCYGAHLIKNGLSGVLRALVEEGHLTHLATQGAGIIHDWEFAFCGVSTESVRDNAQNGTFGSWDETGMWLNLPVVAGAAEGKGIGESVGEFMSLEGICLPDKGDLEEMIGDEPLHELTAARADLLYFMHKFEIPDGDIEVPHPYKKYSVTCGAYEAGVPLTVHPGIGYDIIVNHPMYWGAAQGRGAAIDTRIFGGALENLSGGIYLSVGSAIMSPQVFEKAFSAANNVRKKKGKAFIFDHKITINDLQDGGGWDWSKGEPPMDHAAYYLRFCKTFYRMGGRVDYVQGDNRLFLGNLLKGLRG